MTVLALTIFISSALVCFFLLLFVITIVNGDGAPREMLLPLQEDHSVRTASGTPVPPKGGDIQ